MGMDRRSISKGECRHTTPLLSVHGNILSPKGSFCCNKASGSARSSAWIGQSRGNELDGDMESTMVTRWMMECFASGGMLIRSAGAISVIKFINNARLAQG